MSKPLSELRKRIKPEVQAAARAKSVAIVAEMSLAEARKADKGAVAAIREWLRANEVKP